VVAEAEAVAVVEAEAEAEAVVVVTEAELKEASGREAAAAGFRVEENGSPVSWAV
jgi:hypothetical protein